jgi:GNAT superfamily N-acetyltransferase
MDQPIVRRATVDDVATLAEMRRDFTDEHPPAGRRRADYEESFRALVEPGIRDGSWVVWVADVAGEIVAHAFVTLVEKVPRPVEAPSCLGYLTNVYVRPSHRNHGIGARVLAEVTKWAQADGLELLIVWPSEESVSLYTRQGFLASEQPLVWTNPDHR